VQLVLVIINDFPAHGAMQEVCLQDVVRGLNRQASLYLPPGVTFMVIHSFIRDACKLASEMYSLPRPLDIAPAAPLELFDETK
jgi:hypothetical protein